MKKKILGFLIIFSFVFILNGTVTFETEKRGNDAIPDQEAKLQSAPDRILVKYKKQADIRIQESVKLSIEAANGIEEIRNFSFIDVYIYKTYWDKERTLEELSKNPNVEYAEPDYIVYPDSKIPNDLYFADLWGLHNESQTGGTADADIDAPEAWDLTTGSNDVIVAVIDSGVDYNHEDLNANMWTNPGEIPDNDEDDDGNGYVDDYYGINAINDSGDPMDDDSHGTHCAGTIAAVGNNDIGVVGVCWTAKIMALKFLALDEGGFVSDAIKCIEYAIDKGANIMNSSWGGGGFNQALIDAIEASKKASILFVASAGSDGSNNDEIPHYPASHDCDNIIAVAATDHNDDLASFSNYGAYSVDVAAPGVSILSTIPKDEYEFFNGTSMAAPHVAGLAALIKSYDPNLNWQQIRNRILVGVEQKDSLQGKVLTGGRINAYNSPTLGDITSYTLNVKSSPSTDAYVEVTPDDLSGHGDGYTNFERMYTPYTKVTLSAPSTHNGIIFGYWLLKGARYSTDTSISISMGYDHTATAVYPIHTLAVESVPDTNIHIQVTPADENGEGSGDTNFTRKYQHGTNVTLTVPDEPNGKKFLYWLKNGKQFDTNSSTSITVDNDYCLTAVIFEIGAWTTGGPYGGYVNSLAMSQTNPDIIYAGTDYGVYKTTDGAATWTKTGFPNTLVWVVQVAPDNPDIVYAGPDDGIYKSENGGGTWTQKGLVGVQVNAIAIDRLDPEIMFAGTGRGGNIVGVFKSTDEGETWEQKLSEKEFGAVWTLLIDTEDSSYIYAGVEDGSYGLYRSPDGGETWDPITSSSYPVVALAMTPAGFSPAYIFAVIAGFERNDVYATADRFETWGSTGAPAIPWNPPWALAVDPSDPFTVYLGAGYSLYKSPAGSATWLEKANGLPRGNPSGIVIDPRDSAVLYASFSEGGIYKSIDAAESWNLTNLKNTYVEGLAVHPTSSATVFAAIKGGKTDLAKTTNGGISWDSLSRTDCGAVTINPQDPSTIYAGFGWQRIGGFSIPCRIYKSTDGGQSWTSTGILFYSTEELYVGVSDIWINPSDSSTVLVAVAGFGGMYKDGGGVYRSTDGGATWQQTRGFWANTLASDPTNSDIIYFGTERLGYVFRSTDGGINWTQISPGDHWVWDVRDIEVDSNSHVYAATSNGLMKWNGSDWNQLTGLPTADITALAIDRDTNPETIYVGSDENGVFVSQDGGSTWSAFNNGLGNLNITKLAMSNTQPKMLYAGTAYGAVWSISLVTTYTISGRVTSGGSGLEGIVMDGLPGNPTTDASGNYSDAVDYGWSGTVTPQKEGYDFNPTHRDYTDVTSDQVNQDYTATIIVMCTISGIVKTSDETGIEGVTITFSNEGGSTTTDSSGNYSRSVNEGWSGTATPSKVGYTFLPDSRSYENVTSDQTGQGYTATLLTYTISGMVSRGEALGKMKVAGGPRSEINSEFPQNRQTDKMSVSSSSGSMVTQSGLSGVVMNGLPGNPTTDDSGNYSATVEYGWSGTVTPTKAGYTFSPSSRTYTNVTFDHTGEDYAATIITYTISGNVSTGEDLSSRMIQATGELSGVDMDGLPGNPTTDASGNYSATVDYGWSGTVTPTKAGYSFSPPSKTYANVTSDQQNQSYTASIFKPTLIIQAAAGGTTTPSPGTYVYDYGTEVSITATPDSGCRCAGWTGDVPSGHENDNPVNITMDSDKTITANFIRQYTLTIVAGTGGTTSPAPGSHPCDSGTQVSVTATVTSTGYQFSHWSGDASGSANPVTITMDSDKSITATFIVIPPAETGDGDGGGGGGCFIATAAYGSPLHPHLDILRNFRDKYLMPNGFGRKLVELYYRYSPSIADFIAKHKVLKAAVRINLLPFIAFSYLMVNFSPAASAVMLLFILVLPVFYTWFFRIKD